MHERLLYLSRNDVESVGLSPAETLAALEAMFREKAAGRVDVPPKLGLHLDGDAFIHAMPSYVPGAEAAGVKWIAAFPENRARGVPQVSGLIVLNRVDTGLPEAILDATWVTAQRTAAASALAARYLARKDACSLGILGCGIQGRSHLDALAIEFGIERVVAYDPVESAAASLAEVARERWGMTAVRAARPADAVDGCDLVVTAGPIAKRPYATIEPGWMKPGAFAASIDYASAWSAAALGELDVICTDDRLQVERSRSEGYLVDLPPVRVELCDLVAGRAGRRSAEERTMACLLGLAAEDVVVARLIVDRALERQVGRWLSL